LLKRKTCTSKNSIQFSESNLWPGDDSAVDTPVPISNTEVKHCIGDGTRMGRVASCQVFLCPLAGKVVMIHEQFDLLFTKNRYIFEKNIKKCDGKILNNRLFC
jgi:hypothetical protein